MKEKGKEKEQKREKEKDMFNEWQTGTRTNPEKKWTSNERKRGIYGTETEQEAEMENPSKEIAKGNKNRKMKEMNKQWKRKQTIRNINIGRIRNEQGKKIWQTGNKSKKHQRNEQILAEKGE